VNKKLIYMRWYSFARDA